MEPECLENAIGVFGAIAVIAICIAPFLRLSIHYIMYKIAAAVSSTIGDEKIIGLIDNLASAFGIVLGMTASCALLLFISLISTISGGDSNMIAFNKELVNRYCMLCSGCSHCR